MLRASLLIVGVSLGRCCTININADPTVTPSNLATYIRSQPCLPTSLDVLIISDTNLSTLAQPTFAGLSQLKSIYINNCGIMSLPGNIFATLSSLTYLSLSNNLLTSLAADTFVGMNSNNGTPLTLDLSYNRLTSLVSGLFADSNSLTNVYIKNNQLISLEASVFSGAPVEWIDLSFNQLTGFVPNTFSGLAALRRVLLNDNNLMTSGFHTGLFSDSLFLNFVNIKNNPGLVSLPPLVFGGALVPPLDVQMDTPPKCTNPGLTCVPCRTGQLSPSCYYIPTSPTVNPTFIPTRMPSTQAPSTRTPTASPTKIPTQSPTIQPTQLPTTRPTLAPTATPTARPTSNPTTQPTTVPTTFTPTQTPTTAPTQIPTTSAPTNSPTSFASTSSPTINPAFISTNSPTSSPTPAPITTITTASPSTSLANPTTQSAFNGTNGTAPTTMLPTSVTRTPTAQPTNASGAQTLGGYKDESGDSNLALYTSIPVVAVFVLLGLVCFLMCNRRKLTVDGKIMVHLQNESVVGPGSRPGSIEFRDASQKQGAVDLKICIPLDDRSIPIAMPASPSSQSISSTSTQSISPSPLPPVPRSPVVLPEIPMHEVEIGAPLGNGAFGSVHQCLWRGTDYALKRILSHDQGLLFEKEIEINRQLAAYPHIYVTRMVGLISSPTVAIVMDLYPMGNVEDFLRTNLLGQGDFPQLLTVLINASAGVMHLHSLGIIHRDLAARNFLIKQDLSTAVCDFGLAMNLPEGKTMGQRTALERQTDMLPVNVAAPETLSDGIYSPSSDVYLFGMFIWEVMARQCPHAERKEFSIEQKDFKGFIHMVVNEDLRPQVPFEWPACIRVLIAQCWHRNAASRPTMNHVNEALRNCRREIMTNNILLPMPCVHLIPVDQRIYYAPADRLPPLPLPDEAGESRRSHLYGQAGVVDPLEKRSQYYGQAAEDPPEGRPSQFNGQEGPEGGLNIRNHPYYRPPPNEPMPIRNLYDFGPELDGN